MNPDRSTHWLTEQLCIISSTIIRCAKKSNIENLSSPSLEIFRLCVQSFCPMFNVSSLKESQFQALYSFICSEEVFVNLPTRSGKSLMFQMVPLVHM